MVKIFGLKASDVTLLRGGLQTIIFSLLVAIQTVQEPDNNHSADEPSLLRSKALGPKLKLYGQVCLYGLFVSTCCFACLAALPLMPIGDVIVISFTAPIFSVIFERIFLNRKLTFLSVFLCCIIGKIKDSQPYTLKPHNSVVGDILVIQPDFIFNKSNSPISNSSYPNISITIASTSEEHEVTFEPSTDAHESHGTEYLIGVVLCLLCAATISAANIVQVLIKTSEEGKAVTRNHLMISSGVWNILLSVSTLPVLPNTLLTAPMTMSMLTLAMLGLSSFITLIAMWMLVTAVSLTQHPTLVSMLRSTEIVISLVTESIYWGHLPSIVSAMGSLMVLSFATF